MFLKLKQKKNMKISIFSSVIIFPQIFWLAKFFLMVFITKLKIALFGGSTDFFQIFFSALACRTIDTQMLFWSVFFKRPKTVKMVFLAVNNFFCAFSKIPTKTTSVRLLFLKLNQSRNRRNFFLQGVFFKNQKRTFAGVQNGTF